MNRFIAVMGVLAIMMSGCHPRQKKHEGTPELAVAKPLRKDTLVTREYVSQIRSVRHIELRVLEAAKLNVQAARAQFYPSIGFKAGLGFEAFNGKFLFQSPESLVYGIAGELVAPLINRNAIKAEFSNANARQLEAVYEYEQTIINAYIEVVNQLSRLKNLEQNFNLKEEQVNSLTTSITVANQLFQSARADYMEVLLTQRDALEARMELIETKKDQLVAQIDLYRSLGGGWQ